MKKFRRKPFDVEAIQYFYNDALDPKIPFFLDLIQQGYAYINNDKQLVLPDIQGASIARHGDWVIRHSNGDLTTCSNKYFQANFEVLS